MAVLSDGGRRTAEAILGRYPAGRERSAVLPLLYLMQSVEGRLTRDGLREVGELLGITTAEVEAVASFYTMLRLRPTGKHVVSVCTNLSCALLGGDDVYAQLSKRLGVGHDETTADGKVTLEHVECNAACDFAPVVMVNWEFMDRMTPTSATQLVDDLRSGKEVHSTRGPRIGTWREAERVLAGYPDGRVDEGPGAGHASPRKSLSTPAMMRRSVLLPAPLLPSTPILAPG